MVFTWNLYKVASLGEVLESISDEELAKITSANVITKVKVAANACAAFQEDPLVSDATLKKQLSNFMTVGELLRTDEKAQVGIESFLIKNRSQASKDQELMVTLRKSILDLATRVFSHNSAQDIIKSAVAADKAKKLQDAVTKAARKKEMEDALAKADIEIMENGSRRNKKGKRNSEKAAVRHDSDESGHDANEDDDASQSEDEQKSLKEKRKARKAALEEREARAVNASTQLDANFGEYLKSQTKSAATISEELKIERLKAEAQIAQAENTSKLLQALVSKLL